MIALPVRAVRNVPEAHEERLVEDQRVDDIPMIGTTMFVKMLRLVGSIRVKYRMFARFTNRYVTSAKNVIAPAHQTNDAHDVRRRARPARRAVAKIEIPKTTCWAFHGVLKRGWSLPKTDGQRAFTAHREEHARGADGARDEDAGRGGQRGQDHEDLARAPVLRRDRA